jgi:circadian clock protein KaiC
LMHSQDGATETDAGLSSLMDAWILLLNREIGGEFNRELYLLKARGMAHSNQVREFVMSTSGITLIPPYIGDGRALTGSQRKSEEARLRRAEVDRKTEVERKSALLRQKKRKALAQIEALQAELEADEVELKLNEEAEAIFLDQAASDKADMEKSRKVAE